MKRMYAFFAVAFLGSARVNAQPHQDALAHDQCPDSVPTTGVYRNFSYGFTVTIPVGLSAFWNSAACHPDGDICVCMSDHGRTIPLGTDGAAMGIFAAYNATFETLPTLLVNDVNTFRSGASEFDSTVLELEHTLLGRLKGYRYKAALTRGNTTIVREAIVAVARRGADTAMEYTVYIEAPESIYKSHHREFRQLLLSWRASPRE